MYHPLIYPQESHIGHARNYLAADIIRRVMEDYFGYRVRMVMNVTDVDDKIILKARRAFLLQRYRDSNPDAGEVRDFICGRVSAAVASPRVVPGRVPCQVRAGGGGGGVTSLAEPCAAAGRACQYACSRILSLHLTGPCTYPITS